LPTRSRLFTDIVGSTRTAAELGDARWKHATFDGPARAVRCAQAIAAAIQPLGLETRAGVHTGEVELVEERVQGIAVHIGARVAGLAGPSEVIVSSTVKDLTAGSGLVYEDAGEHELKGVPDLCRLYRVVGS
jgi:class 3 adenylate cyclase